MARWFRRLYIKFWRSLGVGVYEDKRHDKEAH